MPKCDYPTGPERRPVCRPVCGAPAEYEAIPWGEDKHVPLCDDHRIQGHDDGVLFEIRRLGEGAPSAPPPYPTAEPGRADAWRDGARWVVACLEGEGFNVPADLKSTIETFKGAGLK